MCGICGKLNFDRHLPPDAELLHRMMDCIDHRGPDGSGDYMSGPIALGHRRLSIIDLHTGGQPIGNEDGSIQVVYNGEIYNFAQLRTELQAKGHRFRSVSDTEVIVHLYEEVGDDCVSRLRGMFAFALWDARRQRLLLARDRAGVKPLYYARTRGGLLFSSELKALLLDPAVDRNINPRAIDLFLTYYYVPGVDTPFRGISKLAPGHYLTVHDGRVTITQYWDLRFDQAPADRSFGQAVGELRELLSCTVRDHMISDVPVGVLLSGGVDSTSVLSYAARHASTPIHTFTVGFGGSELVDERPYARLAAQRFGTIHHETTIFATDFRELLPKYVWHMEELVCEPPAIALHHVANTARLASVKVLLSGEGGDEAFGGYETYRNVLMLEKMKSAAGPAKGLLRFAFDALSHAGCSRLRRYSNLVEPALAQYYFSRTSSPFTPFNRLKPLLYQRRFAEALGDESSDAPTRRLFERVPTESALNQMLYLDTKSWLPDDLLVKADKMTMAASVELRVPLLDHRVLEFAASLPERYKVSGWQLKRILKAAMEESVPRNILRRRKAGFPVPYARWMRFELGDFVFDAILSRDAGLDAYLRPQTVGRLLDRYRSHGKHPKEIFCLLVLALWQRQFARTQPLACAA